MIRSGREVTDAEAEAHPCDLGRVEALRGEEVMETWTDPGAQRLDEFGLWFQRMVDEGATGIVAVCACGAQRVSYWKPVRN